jgi:uncharacterized protein
MTPRTRRNLPSFIFLVAVGIALLDGFVVEPRWLRVSTFTVPAAVTRPLRVAQVSDLHTRGDTALQRQVVAALAEAKPDAILITGDLIDKSAGIEPVYAFVAQIDAPLGVWFSPGNWEHWILRGPEKNYYSGSRLRVLVNEAAQLRDDVWLVALDDAYAGVPRPRVAFENAPDGVARIAMIHAPTGFDAVDGKVDLALAGHTHGGQVRLPLIGGFILPPGSAPFDAGWYGSGSTRMYVSVGIGTSILPVRFMCRPEVAIFDLVPK